MAPKDDPYIALRQIPVESLVGLLGKVQLETRYVSQGREHIQFMTAYGRLSITPQPGDPHGDLWHFYSGNFAGEPKTYGAINFVLVTGLAPDLRSASEFLRTYVGPAHPRLISWVKQTQPAARAAMKPFKPPARTLDPADNWQAIQTYLCAVRKLPGDVLQPLVARDHPPVMAGWGPIFGHYMIFPLRDHTDPKKPEVGAILRWKGPGIPMLYGGNPGAKVAGTDGSKGWWQVGPYPTKTLIVVEAPIDALSLWSAFTPGDRQTTRILATGGTGFPSAPGVFAGVKIVIAAQDRDVHGDEQAQATIATAQGAGCTVPVRRLRPPIGTKDWNEVWQASPDTVRRMLAQVLHIEREGSLSR